MRPATNDRDHRPLDSPSLLSPRKAIQFKNRDLAKPLELETQTDKTDMSLVAPFAVIAEKNRTANRAVEIRPASRRFHVAHPQPHDIDATVLAAIAAEIIAQLQRNILVHEVLGTRQKFVPTIRDRRVVSRGNTAVITGARAVAA